MNQINYQAPQPNSFDPALAFSSQAQIHSGGQSFFPRNSAGPQAFPQASYPGSSKPPALQQSNAGVGGGNVGNGVGGGFGFPSGGPNMNVNGTVTNNVSQMLQQQQQQQLGGQQSFTSAPYSPSIAGSAVRAPSVSLDASNSASPFHGSSPQMAGFTQLPSQSQSVLQHSGMGPPQIHSQVSPHAPVRSQSQPRSPKSPASVARERERMELLLEINNELLQEMHNLQAQGKGGAPTQEISELMARQGLNPQMGTPEFAQVSVRVQANLGYLCGATDHALRPGSKQAPHPPNYVRAPAAMPQLAEKYSRLRVLFPGWSGVDGNAGSHKPTMSISQSAGNLNFTG
ncbi:hypothetical protein AAFC00_001661 [Neodothiora populina]|uniref:Uncharacterized protein n=1 Tax=Neodothiora populina TaxID=2781224 RepID=A0ABR3PPQ4_9PEZI